jgi:prolyl-tRNA synthetase
LEATAVEADSGTIGGSHSHEFHVIANSGEDAIAQCLEAGYSANVEKVSLPIPKHTRPSATAEMKTVATPGVHTIQALCKFLAAPPESTLKTLLVKGVEGPVALVLRGDHELNQIKAEALDRVATPLQFTNAEEVQKATGVEPGSIGPVALSIPVIADYDAVTLANFVCGANVDGHHLVGVNWGRDLPEPQQADLRRAIDGDPCPLDSSKSLTIRRGIEVGHVFQLGTKYSEALDVTCLDASGKTQTLYMGCYGIGITRIVAAAIEQSHDANGIIWPDPIAPFDVCIVPIGLKKSIKVQEAIESLYHQLHAAGFDVLLDDRDERPGVMFSEMDLIGIPHRLVIGERGLKSGTVEYRNRRDQAARDYPLETLVETLKTLSNI